ncbi:MAG: Flp pilus assembly protein CpaB, partial [Myxococcales bacterium]|nr:Flp pilus assembly protein CpaB [Myxococcales bacterium]
MKAKALILAIAVAGIGVGLLYLYMRRYENEVSGGAMVEVLVAKKDIPLGEPLTDEMVGVGLIPQRYLTTRHIASQDLNRILGVRVRTQVRAAESILWTDLATSTEHSRDLSSLISDGMRAVTIGTSGGAFGGLLRPGDRVDILLTVSQEGLVPRTLAVLQNLMVIAVGGDTGGGRAEGEQQTSVTFAVTVEQAQLLTFSGTLGNLSLTLRNPDDITVVDDLPETSIEDVIQAL